jgi:hypothetical protein
MLVSAGRRVGVKCEWVAVAQRQHVQQLEAVINLGRRLSSKENVLQCGVGIRRVGGDAAHVVSHRCNHFRRQGTKNMAVAEVGKGNCSAASWRQQTRLRRIEKPSNSVFSSLQKEERERRQRWVQCC